MPWLFNWSIVNTPALNKTFDVALHMGTLVGGLVYFWRDVVKYVKAFIRSVAKRSISGADERVAWALVMGTIPAGLIGAVFEEQIQNKLGEPWLIATMLAVGGVLLWYVDLKCRSDRHFDSIDPRTGLMVGLAQALALQPGVSRSGITMTFSRILGIDREAAARFSFMLAMPIIAGAGLFKGAGMIHEGFQGYSAQFFWGFVASAISGFVVIWGLLGYLRKHSFAVFMWYRLAVAALVFILIATGARTASILAV